MTVLLPHDTGFPPRLVSSSPDAQSNTRQSITRQQRSCQLRQQ
jgi:hypothetical protein